jgi:hypothetical protein
MQAIVSKMAAQHRAQPEDAEEAEDSQAQRAADRGQATHAPPGCRAAHGRQATALPIDALSIWTGELAVLSGGFSRREAAKRFGVHRNTITKMLSFSVPPGDRRRERPGIQEAGALYGIPEGDSRVSRSNGKRRVGFSSGCGMRALQE